MPEITPAAAVRPEDIPTAWVDAVYPVTLKHGIPWHDDAIRIMLAAALPSIDEHIREAVTEDEIDRVRREAAEHIASLLKAVDPVEWALAGQRAGEDAAQIAREAFPKETDRG